MVITQPSYPNWCKMDGEFSLLGCRVMSIALISMSRDMVGEEGFMDEVLKRIMEVWRDEVQMKCDEVSDVFEYLRNYEVIFDFPDYLYDSLIEKF